MFQFGSNWLQHYNLQKIYCKRKRISEFIIDETLIQIGKDYFWLWVAIIEPSNKEVLGIHLSLERNTIVAEQFLKHLVINYGKHKVYSDGGTWYPKACISLGLKHRLHSSVEKSIIERAMEYVKDRTENFDDYYPCGKKLDCDLNHVYHWFTLFIFLHNIKSYSGSINYLVGGGDKA
jgi:putative transposase